MCVGAGTNQSSDTGTNQSSDRSQILAILADPCRRAARVWVGARALGVGGFEGESDALVISMPKFQGCVCMVMQGHFYTCVSESVSVCVCVCVCVCVLLLVSSRWATWSRYRRSSRTGTSPITPPTTHSQVPTRIPMRDSDRHRLGCRRETRTKTDSDDGVSGAEGHESHGRLGCRRETQTKLTRMQTRDSDEVRLGCRRETGRRQTRMTRDSDAGSWARLWTRMATKRGST